MVVEKGLKAKNLKGVRDWMELFKMGVTTLKTDERRNEESWYGFLDHAKKGVFLIRLYETGVVDHVVVLDCGRRLIFDSAEVWPLKLSMDALEACAGDEAVRPRIIKLREVVLRGQA